MAVYLMLGRMSHRKGLRTLAFSESIKIWQEYVHGMASSNAPFKIQRNRRGKNLSRRI
jgi:hypothetical protein